MIAEVARLDAELVRRGLARSRSRAAELVGAGRVRVGTSVARKPSQQVAPDCPIGVEDDPEEKVYVSRAALKLAGALDAIAAAGGAAPDPAGARCLDAGASTGGFTQVLLERGASHVDAVDVGHGQVAPEVAADVRVTVYEGMNVRNLPAELCSADLVVADLSFISLTVVMGSLLAATDTRGQLLLMVKPQFEVGRERLGSSGVVGSSELRVEAVLGVVGAAARLGATLRGVVPSPLPGPAGNREYFVWLVPGDGAHELPVAAMDAVRRAVQDGVTVLLDDGRLLP